MKKLLLTLLLLILFPLYSFAAGTVTRTDYAYRGATGRYEIRYVTLTVTFGSDNAAPADTALDDITATDSNPGVDALAGWWLLEIDIIPGTTGPTDNTDLYLYRPAASTSENTPGFGTKKIDVLGGQGVNAIDNATISTLNPLTITRPLTGEEILDIDNNAVANATCTITLTLYR